ncbi:hypothetical protein [Canibacter zhoujuaniae]|uniref:hypothetical protein n=1 Tax=Canibacter zhoujuaniae TaxID=2708343 RepID=UPI001421266E|nr:hypothetical protein [Canibacter zhoujuaniae]
MRAVIREFESVKREVSTVFASVWQRQADRARLLITGDETVLRHALRKLQQQNLMLRAGVLSARVSEAQPFQLPTRRVIAREIEALYACLDSVATESGAPRSLALESLSTNIAALLELRKRRRLLAAGPQASMFLIALLPVLAIAVGELLGFAPLSVMFTPIGAVLAVAGFSLLLVGVRWLRRMITATLSKENLVGFECELMVLALAGGMPLQAAQKCVANAILESGSTWLSVDQFAPHGAVAGALVTAELTCTGANSILLANAADLRRKSLEQLEIAAEQLGAKLLLPMGLCVLPAFVLLGVVPVIISMLGQWSIG